MDYLYEANQKRKSAKEAIKVSNYNEAWSLLQEVSEIYMDYVNSQDTNTLDKAWAIGLIHSVSEERALILSKEGKHKDALYHATLKAVTESRPIKKYKDKMMIYFRKAKLLTSEKAFLLIFQESVKNKDPLQLRNEIEKLV